MWTLLTIRTTRWTRMAARSIVCPACHPYSSYELRKSVFVLGHLGRRRRRAGVGAQSRYWHDARTLLSARLGGGRSLEFHARGERPLVFLDQGRAGANALRHVPRPRAARRVHAARRRPD